MQDTFKQVINEAIKPLLKAAKFKKKALNFYKVDKGLIYLINLQKSHGNSSREVSFYVNCAIHSNNIEEALDQPITTFPKEYQCHFSQRIANLSSHAPDKFLIRPSTNIDALKTRIELSLKEVLRVFQTIEENHSFVAFVCQKGSLQQEDIFRYCLKKGLATDANTLVDSFKKNIEEERWSTVFKGFFLDILEEEHTDITITALQG